MTISLAFTHKIQSNKTTYSFWNCSSSKEEKARGIPRAVNHQKMFFCPENYSGLMSLTYVKVRYELARLSHSD